MKQMLRDCNACKYKDIKIYGEPCVKCKSSNNKFEEVKKEIDITNTDNVNHPQHYMQGAIECIDVIEEITKPLDKFEAYIIGTVLKYLWRFKFKNGLEDLQKARWYLDKLIENMEAEKNG